MKSAKKSPSKFSYKISVVRYEKKVDKRHGRVYEMSSAGQYNVNVKKLRAFRKFMREELNVIPW